MYSKKENNVSRRNFNGKTCICYRRTVFTKSINAVRCEKVFLASPRGNNSLANANGGRNLT